MGSTCVIWSTKSRLPRYTVILPFDELFLKTLQKIKDFEKVCDYYRWAV